MMKSCALIVFVFLFVSPETEALLSQCEEAISSQFLAKKQPSPTILGNFYGKRFWTAASNDLEFPDVPVSTEYGTEVNNACQVTVSMYHPNGTVNVFTRINTDHLENRYLGHTLNSGMNAAYAFHCSEHLIAMYRCQMSWQSAGPSYQVYAPWGKTEADISEQLASCVESITAIDEAADLWLMKRPSEE